MKDYNDELMRYEEDAENQYDDYDHEEDYDDYDDEDDFDTGFEGLEDGYDDEFEDEYDDYDDYADEVEYEDNGNIALCRPHHCVSYLTTYLL